MSDSTNASSVENAESASVSVMSTPAATEGDTATEEEELETEDTDAVGNETELELATTESSKRVGSPAVQSQIVVERRRELGMERERSPTSHHDLVNKYFRNDTIFLKNWDIFRYASLR